jgi:hypothetical protein
MLWTAPAHCRARRAWVDLTGLVGYYTLLALTLNAF